ncbi:MAG: bifunctional phosphopantothenoylcysteine decarboxylase/phosphopantothenate--cysteine ligase CoaBC [Cyanobacteria bacterium J06638_22]
MLKDRRILIGVGGGIAAYKVCEVVSTLAKAGAEVRVMVTEGAQRFITPLTLATLARHPAYTDADFWQPTHHRPLHIDLGEWAEVMAIAPLTANTLGKLAYGLADNLLTNTVLASTCPILLAPAMNTDMWLQQSVQRNWEEVLQDRRYHSLTPGEGILACDRVGAGRMAEPPELLAALESLLHTGGDRDLQGKHLLIDTGGTREFLDPVRFIGNPSTGKMGIALAQAALHRGATVTLVHGVMDPALLAQVKGARQIQADTAATMHRAMLEQQPDADWVVLAAAVADVKPTHYTAHKLPKANIPTALALSPVPDIAADLSAHRLPHQQLIGFAAQTGDIVQPAHDKLQRKKLDIIVANPIDQPESGFGGDRNQAILLNAAGEQQAVPLTSKLHLAHVLYDFVLATNP